MKIIEQLKKKDLNCNIFSVYDYDGLTITELLCQFFNKINECIDTSNETIDLAKWLVNEGLEIEVAKKLVVWLEDGTLENIINVNLFNSLNEKFNTISGLTNRHLEIINDKNDNVGNLNIANFSGQDLGANTQIGQIFHHYTDGIAYQIDNVGENNNILILKNASNPSRRPDKSNDFVGSGMFLQCLEHSTGGSSKRIFSLGTKGEMYWFDGDNSTVFGNNKSNNGSSAFKFDVYNKHSKLIEVSNGYTTEFLMNHNSVNNQLELIAGLNASGGLKIQTINGPIELTSGNEQIIINGKPLVYNNGNYQSVQTIKNGTPQSRPTPIAVGDNYFDTQLGKPIWCKQISPSIIWVDATGATV